MTSGLRQTLLGRSCFGRCAVLLTTLITHSELLTIIPSYLDVQSVLQVGLHQYVSLQIEERKRLHAKLMQKVRERQIKPSEAADEMQAEVSIPCSVHIQTQSVGADAYSYAAF